MNCRYHRYINTRGLELVKYYEGFKSRPYLCAGGYPTIGYGHRITKGEQFDNISKWQAEEILAQDLYYSEQAVVRYIENHLNDNQFAALVSFTFNLGAAALQRSTLRQKLNCGLYQECSSEFGKWVYVKLKKIPGLVSRREAERQMFISSG